jgi:hypothetical protein
MPRVKDNLSFRATGEANFQPLGQRVLRRGRGWSGEGEWSEQGERMEGTLLMRWEKGYEEKLAVVTDLPPEHANVAWYQMRFWIEDEYKDHKRGGLRWEQTKMTNPARAKRLWLAMAMAMQLAILVGGQLEEEERVRQARKRGRGKARKPKRVGRPAKPIRRPRDREQSCLARGQQAISAAAVRGEALPVGYGVAEAWPIHTYAVGKAPSSYVKKRKHKEMTKRQRKSKQAEARRRERAEQAEQRRVEQAARRKLRQEKAREKKPPKKEQDATGQASAKARVGTRQHRQREREAHLREREQLHRDREQQQEERQRWHEEIAHERQLRLARKQERADRRAQAALASRRSASPLFVSQEAFAPPAQPP